MASIRMVLKEAVVQQVGRSAGRVFILVSTEQTKR